MNTSLLLRYKRLRQKALGNYPNEMNPDKAANLFNASVVLCICGLTYGLLNVLVSRPQSALITGVFGFLMLFSPLLFLNKVPLNRIGILYNFMGYLVISMAVTFKGGLASPSLVWIAAPPLFTLLLVNRKWAVVFFFMSLIFFLTLVYLNQNGIEFGSTMAEHKRVLYLGICFIGLLPFLVVLSAIFDNQQQIAINDLKKENAKIQESNSQLQIQRNNLDKNRALLDEELVRSKSLLKNILPDYVAAELLEQGQVTPRNHDDIVMMFTDFVGFDNLSKQMTPDELVKFVEFYFEQFDEIITKHNLKKIKTFGNSYLAVAGINNPNPNYIEESIIAALEIRDFVKREVATRKDSKTDFLEVKIGLHIGSVTAGVIGQNKFAYDIWGNAVNLAFRTQQSCEPGNVNITDALSLKAEGKFDLKARGLLQVKNIGSFDFFYVQNQKKAIV